MAPVLEKPQSITQAVDAPVPYTHEDYERLTTAYPRLRVERTAEGEIIIMPPAGGGSSRRNLKITTQLGLWAEQDGTGEAFDSSAGFTLPNGADRAPDAAWVEKSRWDALTPDQQEKFLPLCPDFAAELLSPSDRLARTQEKMREYIANGARLAWLLNPRDRTVEVYRPGHEVETLENPTTVSGEDVLPGFVLILSKVWG